MSDTATQDPRLVAGIEMLGRTGAEQFQVRYSDDEQPTLWMAVVLYPDGKWETAAGHDAVDAVMRLCAQIVDGGRCTTCGKTTAFLANLDSAPLVEALCCARQWDPELATFRRSCEGET